MRDNDVWIPQPEHIANANVTALAHELDLDGYDALYSFSIARPAEYWEAVNRFCRIAWSRGYDRYVDLSAGTEFPQWFVGGELNWVDTVLTWADDSTTAGYAAVIAEREDGSCVSVSYTELREQVRSLAAGLARLGVRRGDRIGLLMESGVEAVVSLLAISYVGAIVAPQFSGFGADAIISRLKSCSARGVIATTGFSRRGTFVDALPTVMAAKEHLPELEFVILKPSVGGDANDADALFWDDILADGSAAVSAARMSANDPFMVIYTSGTTGQPKGAVHTHGGFPLKIAHDAAVHFNLKQGDVLCWPADIGWIAGPLVIASALMRGATLVCYDGAPDFPGWSRMSRLIEKHRVTHFGSSPTLIRGFAANGAEATTGDMSSVEMLITAGEVIAPEHFLWFQQTFGRGEVPVINYTGGTEVSGGLLSNVMVKPIVPGGFNTPSLGIEMDVVDLSGQSLRNEVGELAILAPFVGMTQAFWQDRNRYLDTYWRTVPGKWIHGDLALRDDSDTFFLVGRSDDTIKVAGKRIGPAEVEQVVVELATVNEAAVIGVDDPAKGQVLVLFVVLVDGDTTDHARLRQMIVERIQTTLGKPFIPKEVHIVTQLPKTRSGKVMRRVIRNLYSKSPPGDLSSLVNPEAVDEIERTIRP